MNRYRILFLAVLALFMTSSLYAAELEIEGAWLSTIPYSGKAIQQAFNLEVSGETLTGTVRLPFGTFDISDGKVKGDEVSFSAAIDNNGEKSKHTYQGKVVAKSESGLSNKEMKIVDTQSGSPRNIEYPAHKAESRMAGGGGQQGGGAPPQGGPPAGR